jgi:hypothetical protein
MRERVMLYFIADLADKYPQLVMLVSVLIAVAMYEWHKENYRRRDESQSDEEAAWDRHLTKMSDPPEIKETKD